MIHDIAINPSVWDGDPKINGIDHDIRRVRIGDMIGKGLTVGPRLLGWDVLYIYIINHGWPWIPMYLYGTKLLKRSLSLVCDAASLAQTHITCHILNCRWLINLRSMTRHHATSNPMAWGLYFLAASQTSCMPWPGAWLLALVRGFVVVEQGWTFPIPGHN